jgi:hypothetical protein
MDGLAGSAARTFDPIVTAKAARQPGERPVRPKPLVGQVEEVVVPLAARPPPADVHAAGQGHNRRHGLGAGRLDDGHAGSAASDAEMALAARGLAEAAIDGCVPDP